MRYFFGGVVVQFLCAMLMGQDVSDSSLLVESPYYSSLRNNLSIYAHGITKLNEIELRDAGKDSTIKVIAGRMWMITTKTGALKIRCLYAPIFALLLRALTVFMP